MRVGEVGGNTLGFYGGLISPGGLLIFAHDYQGGFHLWGKEGRGNGPIVSQDERALELAKKADKCALAVWTSLPTIGGHFAAVQGIAWEPGGGAFLLSVSSDQTSRLHAEWHRTPGEVITRKEGWREGGRDGRRRREGRSEGGKGAGRVIVTSYFSLSEIVV